MGLREGGRGLLRAAAVLAAMAAATGPALAGIGPCAELGIGIEDLFAPSPETMRTYYDGQVAIYVIDEIEPACCSLGLAVILPVPDSSVGDSQCIAITGYRGVGISEAKATYDAEKGLRVEMPTGGTAEDGEAVEGRVLAFRINLAAGTVTLEK